jgi:hypothetical protein
MATVNFTQTKHLQFDAAITDEQVPRLDAAAISFAPVRRGVYAVMSRSSAQLREGMTEDSAEAFLKLAESISEYLDFRKAETEMLESAQARLLAVLSEYEDINLFEESEDATH